MYVFHIHTYIHNFTIIYQHINRNRENSFRVLIELNFIIFRFCLCQNHNFPYTTFTILGYLSLQVCTYFCMYVLCVSTLMGLTVLFSSVFSVSDYNHVMAILHGKIIYYLIITNFFLCQLFTNDLILNFHFVIKYIFFCFNFYH